MTSSTSSVSLASPSTSSAHSSSPATPRVQHQTISSSSYPQIPFATDTEVESSSVFYTGSLSPDTDLLTTLATVSAAQLPSTARVLNTSHSIQNGLSASTSPHDSISTEHAQLHTSNSIANMYRSSNSHTTLSVPIMSSANDDGIGSITMANNAKRQRTGRACDACRRRKVRCDGAIPHCSNCRTANVSCTFLDAAKKRGPPKGYIEAIESRLHRMESLIGAQYPAPSPSSSSLIAGPSTNYRDVGMNETAAVANNAATAHQLSSRSMPSMLHDPIIGPQPILIPPRQSAAHSYAPPPHGHNMATANGSLLPPVMQATASSSLSTANISRLNNGTSNNNGSVNGTNSANTYTERAKMDGFNSHNSPISNGSSLANDPYAINSNDNDPTLAGIMAAVTSLAKEQQEQRQQLNSTAILPTTTTTAATTPTITAPLTAPNLISSNSKLSGYTHYSSTDISRTSVPSLTTFSYACESDTAFQQPPSSFSAKSSQESALSRSPCANGLLLPRLVPSIDGINSLNDQSEIDMNALPDALTSGRLISIFRERIHPYYPILHWRRFLDRLASASPPKLLLNAVYAYASRYDADATTGASMSSDVSHTPGEIYVLRIQMLLESRLSDPDLETVQALLLFSSYLLSMKRILVGHMYNGMAIRLAQQLQLHYDTTMNEIERADQLRTWWGLLFLDRFIATTFFYPLSIDEKDCCPANLGHINIGHITSDDGPFDSSDLYYSYVAQLSVLYGRALRVVKMRLIDGKSPDELTSEIASLDHDLSQWWQNTPNIYLYDPTKESTWQIPTNRLSIVGITTCMYHSAIIMLHRPWGAINGSQRPWAPHINSERLCLASAHTIARIVHRMQHHELPYIFGLYTTSAFCALTVLVPVVASHPDSEIRWYARKDLIKLRNLLRASTRSIQIAKDALSHAEDLCILRGISIYELEESEELEQDANRKYGLKMDGNNDNNDTVVDSASGYSSIQQSPSPPISNRRDTNGISPPNSLSNLLNPEPPSQQQQQHLTHSVFKRQRFNEASTAASASIYVTNDDIVQSISAASSSSGFTIPNGIHNNTPLNEKQLQKEEKEGMAWLKRLCPYNDSYIFPRIVETFDDKEDATPWTSRQSSLSPTTVNGTTTTTLNKTHITENDTATETKGRARARSVPCLCSSQSMNRLRDYTPIYVKDVYYWCVPISMATKRWSQFIDYYSKIPEADRLSKVPFL